MDVVAIVGSLRAGSFNRVVFNAAVESMPDGSTLRELPIADLPLYDGDVEAAGDPTSVVELRAGVEAADGLLVFTPEYNLSVPAVTKNAIDWLSRMPGDSALSRTVTGIVAASPGRGDCANVRRHLGESLSAISGRFHESTLGVASVSRLLTDDALGDADTLASLESWLASFVTFAEQS